MILILGTKIDNIHQICKFYNSFFPFHPLKTLFSTFFIDETDSIHALQP